MRRFRFLLSLVLAGAAIFARADTVRAQELSCITVSIIVPAAVESGSDLVARAIAEGASKVGTTTYRVRNRPRGIARELIESAAPNGCTLLLDTQIRVAFEILKGDREAWRALTPVALLTRTPMAIALSSGGPAKPAPKGEEPETPSLAQIVSELRAKPESVSFALVDDPLEQLLFLQMEEALDVRFRIRSFPTGMARFREMLNGPAGLLSFVSLRAAEARMHEKQLHTLAVTGAAPSEDMPDIPTLGMHAGGLTLGVDHGIYGPAGLPAELVAAHANIFQKVMETRGVLSELHKEYGTESRLITADGFSRYLENLAADWKEMLQRQNNRGRLGQKS
ncbi:tripartite tricarboxylate transporter substrate-binding protein [Nisaea acidiphila]|uniref:Tripartite tricarboxylate transporter substrate-binding protein n=1 Tax=Nisaea acidiphila TaxID=1862145 RepID=A0A9J7AXP6_9PROT|nr:tripartite tricarboxylate transporter substrate-binding protein [Nisaea acidiphila]UUX51209.1 tripartite tricarboxylate transporter substrate-binding protein [Nisaea acidiphila]